MTCCINSLASLFSEMSGQWHITLCDCSLIWLWLLRRSLRSLVWARCYQTFPVNGLVLDRNQTDINSHYISVELFTSTGISFCMVGNSVYVKYICCAGWIEAPLGYSFRDQQVRYCLVARQKYKPKTTFRTLKRRAVNELVVQPVFDNQAWSTTHITVFVPFMLLSCPSWLKHKKEKRTFGRWRQVSRQDNLNRCVHISACIDSVYLIQTVFSSLHTLDSLCNSRVICLSLNVRC